MSNQRGLTAEQQKLNDLWDEHVRTEFSAHAADEAIAMMVENPLVNQVPVLIGGNRRQQVYEFYSKYFFVADSSGPGNDSGLADHRPGPGGG